MCPTLGNPMNCSMPQFPVLHHLPELTQTHVPWVGDAIQPSHPLSSTSSPASYLSQHQGHFKWVRSSPQVTKILELQFQHQSLQWIYRVDFVYNWLVWSCSPRDPQECSPTPQFKSISSSVFRLLYGLTLTSWKNMTTGKTIALTTWIFARKVMSMLFNMLSRFVIAVLPSSKCLLISWLQSPSTVILQPKKIKSFTVSNVSPSIYHEVMLPDAMIFIFWMLDFNSAFSLSSFTFIKRLFSSSSFYAIRLVSPAYLRLLIFLPAILIPVCASYSPACPVMYSVS